MSYIIVSCK